MERKGSNVKQTRLREESLSVSSVHHSLLLCPSGYSPSPPFMHLVIILHRLSFLATLSHSSFKAPLSKRGTVTVK